MFLCFGTYAKVLKLCCPRRVSNKLLVDTLVKTIDPHSKYLDNDTSVSRLLACGANFPEITFSESHGPVRTVDGPITNVVALARTVPASDLALRFDDKVIPLLDKDKIIPAICALQDIIRRDDSINDYHSKTFEDCMGCNPAFASIQSAISPATFLAGLFLYTILTNENKGHKQETKEIQEAYITRVSAGKNIRLLDCPSPDNLSVEDTVGVYLYKIRNTYNVIKTLLYADAPKPFYDFYVCNDLYRYVPSYHNKRSYQRVTISQADMNKLAATSSYIILSGTGGLGKSMMMRHLLLDSAARYDSTGVVPLFIQLKNYKTSFADMIDYILFEISSLWPGASRDILIDILNSGKLLLLFDGLDEIGVDIASSFQASLDAFINTYTENQYIISSRPYGNFAAYTRFTVLNLSPFTKAQSLELIDKLEFRTDMPEIKAKFRSELDHHLYWTHTGFSDNPLLLTIMLMTFEEFAEVPSKMHIFYQEAYTVLAKKHDATKGGFRRALETKLSTDEFADLFARFCGVTYNDEKFEFSWAEMDRYYRSLKGRTVHVSASTDAFIFDVCSNLCIMFLESGKYNFIHRSFQEYFCARFFARQKDKNLERIGKLFEHNRLARQSDQTFRMLYDMIPEKVKEYIIIPYLRDLLAECDRADGYHTFLRKIYGSVEMGDDYVVDKGSCAPNSAIYHFILHRFPISHENEIDAAYVEDTQLLPYTEYYMLDYDDDDEDGDGSEIVEESEIPDSYKRKYGSPCTAGNVYTFDWDEIFDDPEYYHYLIRSIDSEGFPLMLEYKDTRSLYEKLLEEIQHEEDDDLFDILD